MASIRELPSGNWNVQLRIKNMKPKSATFKTKKEAELWVEQQSTEKKSLYSLGVQYCERELTGRGSYNHAMIKLRIIKELIPKEHHLVTPEDINNFKHTRLSKCKADTVISELSLIHRIYRWAFNELIINYQSPVTNIRFPKASKPRSRVITPQELTLLIENSSKVMGQIIELAYETAMRRSEILNLHSKDLNLNERLLRVRNGKTGERDVPLTHRAVELLRQLKPNRYGELFTVKPNSVTQAVRRARHKIGLDDDVRLHQLRHTRCTEVAKKGFNQAQIMAVTGHTDIRSVQRYTHITAHDVVDLI